MDRIICDIYFKNEKPLLGEDKNSSFNVRIQAVNDLYGWLYQKGLLEEASFQDQDLPASVCFALDTAALLPFRNAREQSGIANAGLAVHHLFDEPYTPCMYSGAVELGWFMSTYRDVDGCVGRSWECALVQGLNMQAISEIQKAKTEQGAKAAVDKMFSFYHWPQQEKKTGLLSMISSAEDKASSSHDETHSQKSAIAPEQSTKDDDRNGR